MKKIGLITFHGSINYGVYLQAYALQSVIESFNNHAEIIDYNVFVENKKRISLKVWTSRFLHLGQSWTVIKKKCFNASKKSKERILKFDRFKERYMHLTLPCSSFSDLKKDYSNRYSAIVCGSDQIWNPNYTEANPVYFLDFTGDGVKRVAYAPSFGVATIDDGFSRFYQDYKYYLERFDALSVREESGRTIVKYLIGIEPIVVCDPTMLITKNKWLSIADQNVGEGAKYCLLYLLGENPEYIEMAKSLSQSIRVINIPMTNLLLNLNGVEQNYAAPDEFLALISKAEFIVTDSFHGTAFSIIMQKRFVTLKRTDTKYSLNSRIENLLNKCGLSGNNRNARDVSLVSINDVDYESVSRRLLPWINQSKSYLREAIL